MNDQTLALLIAALIGVLPNVILKLVDKYRSPEQKEKENLEAADISVDTMKVTLEEMRVHNKFLEEKLTSKRSEITVQNNIIYDLNKIIVDKSALLLEKDKLIAELEVKLLECQKNTVECKTQGGSDALRNP